MKQFLMSDEAKWIAVGFIMLAVVIAALARIDNSAEPRKREINQCIVDNKTLPDPLTYCRAVYALKQ